MAAEKKFTVAIVGGGIGGLTLALGLLRRNVQVQVYEAAPTYTENHLGLSISPAAHRAMLLIDPSIHDIYTALITTHKDSPGYEAFGQTFFEFVWGMGEQEGQVILNLKAPPSGKTTLRRADFQKALANAIPKDLIHFGKRLTGYEETSEGVYLSFENSRPVLADVVVGCDGIHSKIRESMLSEHLQELKPRYSGMHVYRTVLSMDAVVEAVGDRRARVATTYVGSGAYVVSYPILRAKKVYIALYVLNETWNHGNWARSASKEDVVQNLRFMGEHVNALLQVTP
jgi:salicylate hydroxylase